MSNNDHLAQLESERRSLVERYARERGLTVTQAAQELAGQSRPPISKEDMEAISAVARKNGISFEEALAYSRGDRPFRFCGAAGQRQTYGRGVMDGADSPPDPAARTPQQIMDIMNNPKPQVTINGRSTITGGTLTREDRDRINERLLERRRKGEKVTFEQVLREYLGEDA
jgi:hypothetical protein